jgi:hypothetical protein
MNKYQARGASLNWFTADGREIDMVEFPVMYNRPELETVTARTQHRVYALYENSAATFTLNVYHDDAWEFSEEFNGLDEAVHVAEYIEAVHK